LARNESGLGGIPSGGVKALSLGNLEVYYGDSHILQDVSYELAEGTVIGLLGRNGAGKSTCMSAIVGLVPPRRGRVQVFGRDVAGRQPEQIAAAGVALVPQGRRIFRSLTVKENLSVAARKRPAGNSPPWTLARVYELFPRLEERQAQYAGSLSGGEQQMLAIGRALMGNPRVMLMDEPSEGLAPLIVAEVGRAIERLKREGLSIVLVEQNHKLAFSLADQIVMLNAGRCTFAGPVADARDNAQLIAENLGVFHGGH
jgi:branched-chain amino acid transport system ATP-binding protein